eukprot:CAMPEP_0119380946 /NCGR_PEP_ID=MMETSP1334-20130426/59113_1 /TAXON_ID=127549 /ORGANISM="Calcidiscus leptoporus, Strain RCC1130" /LENGTH=48 /DNA_ID= /DNA_START= /DNA_END= /DNA_ORIENTATION=
MWWFAEEGVQVVRVHSAGQQSVEEAEAHWCCSGRFVSVHAPEREAVRT